MILLDTNVISEPTKPGANPTVIAWLNQQPKETLYIASTTMAELLFGLTIMPAGERKTMLATVLEAAFQLFGAQRILPFDAEAARAYGHLVGQARLFGRSISVSDGQIAAIAKVKNFSVATRDTGPFIAAGLQVINPWAATI